MDSGAGHELVFWQAVSLHGAGLEAPARQLFRQIFAAEPRWHTLTPRLVPALPKQQQTGGTTMPSDHQAQ